MPQSNTSQQQTIFLLLSLLLEKLYARCHTCYFACSQHDTRTTLGANGQPMPLSLEVHWTNTDLPYSEQHALTIFFSSLQPPLANCNVSSGNQEWVVNVNNQPGSPDCPSDVSAKMSFSANRQMTTNDLQLLENAVRTAMQSGLERSNDNTLVLIIIGVAVLALMAVTHAVYQKCCKKSPPQNSQTQTLLAQSREALDHLLQESERQPEVYEKTGSAGANAGPLDHRGSLGPGN